MGKEKLETENLEFANQKSIFGILAQIPKAKTAPENRVATYSNICTIDLTILDIQSPQYNKAINFFSNYKSTPYGQF